MVERPTFRGIVHRGCKVRKDRAHGVDGGTLSVQLASVGFEKHTLRDGCIAPRIETCEGGLNRGRGAGSLVLRWRKDKRKGKGVMGLMDAVPQETDRGVEVG